MIRIQPIVLHAHFNRALCFAVLIFCTQGVYDAIMNINLKKKPTIGIPQLCIKFAYNHISEALNFNI